MEKLDKFLGCVYGLAIGDALGFPVEFTSLSGIKREYGSKGVEDFQAGAFPKGNYSDDTQMSIATATGLIRTRSDDLDCIMENISKNYIQWLDDSENDRAPGTTCIQGVSNLKKGIHWRDSGNKTSKGCGAAMRTAPIGLYFNDDIPRLIEVAEAASKCTHAHPTGIASGIGTAYLVALALNNEPPSSMTSKLAELGRKFDSDFADKIKQVETVLKYENSELALSMLGEGWTGEEAVALALYCFLKSPKNFRETILRAANTNGDSDSIACISGAISGAYNGIDGIQEKWIRDVEKTDFLRAVAENLYRKYQERISNPSQIYLFAGSLTDELFGFKPASRRLDLVGDMPDQRYILERAIRHRRTFLDPKVDEILVVDKTGEVLRAQRKSLISRNPLDYAITQPVNFENSLLDYVKGSHNKIVVAKTSLGKNVEETMRRLIEANALRNNVVFIKDTGYNEQLLRVLPSS